MVIKYIHPVKPSSAQGLVADVYVQVKRDFGRLVEPFLLHSPLPRLLAGAWMMCRETEVVGAVPRAVKETVAAAVSNLNCCSYCVDAHTIMLEATGEKKAANAISQNRYDDISNMNLKLMAQWASATATPKSPALLSPPFNRQEGPEIIGTAIFYHYINRMVTVLLGETPLPLNQSWLKSGLKVMASRMFEDSIKTVKEPGASLQLMPKASLTEAMHWAKHAPNIAWAYAGFAQAVEEAGEQALPSEARSLVREEVNEWNGKTSELSLAWSEDEICRFDEATQSAARVALFAALAPHKVDAEVVSAYRKNFPEDEKLLGALAWASFAAARKIGTWLQVPPI